MTNRIHRNRKFTNPDILTDVIEAYFDECDDAQEPYTITGLCLALGLTRREFINYNKDAELGPIIEQAHLLIENQLERLLMEGNVRAAGPIFALKNLGWTDRQDVNVRDSSAINADDQRWTVEVVDPKEKKKDDKDVQVPNSPKVTPFPRAKAKI